jgi:hypothetical protein
MYYVFPQKGDARFERSRVGKLETWIRLNGEWKFRTEKSRRDGMQQRNQSRRVLEALRYL